MNKSPGIDGLPGDFYLALLPFHDNLIARLLHAVFIESYKSGILPESMRKSSARVASDYYIKKILKLINDIHKIIDQLHY